MFKNGVYFPDQENIDEANQKLKDAGKAYITSDDKGVQTKWLPPDEYDDVVRRLEAAETKAIHEAQPDTVLSFGHPFMPAWQWDEYVKSKVGQRELVMREKAGEIGKDLAWILSRIREDMPKKVKELATQNYAADNLLYGLQMGVIDDLGFKFCGTPTRLMNWSTSMTDIEKGRRSPTYQHPLAMKAILKRNIRDEDLRHFQEQVSSKKTILFQDIGEGKMRCMPIFHKGQPQYAEKMSRRCYNAAKYLTGKNGTVFFLTITCDIKKYDCDFESAWHGHRADVSNCLKWLRRKGDLSYLSVLESTERGFPHTHMIFVLENQYFDHFYDKRGNCRCKNNEFRQRLKKSCRGNNIDLQICRTEDIAGYITKYVSKGFLPEPEKGKTGPKARSSWRKSVLSIMMTKMLEMRTIRMSKDLTADTSGETIVCHAEDTLKKAILEYRDDTGYGGANFALIALLNKLTTHCPTESWAVNIKPDDMWFYEDMGDITKPVETMADGSPILRKDMIDFLGKQAHKCSCPGCFFSECRRNMIRQFPKDAQKVKERYPDLVNNMSSDMALNWVATKYEKSFNRE